MADTIRSLIGKISALANAEDFSSNKAVILEDLSRMEGEYAKLKFKYERSVKEKGIFSSLLIRTSEDLQKVSDDLKIRAEELSALLDTIPAFVYFKDISLNYAMVNQPFIEMAGLPAREIIGKKTTDVFTGYDNPEYLEHEARVLKDGNSLYDLEEELVKDGVIRWVNSNIAPIRNEDDRIIGLVGI